MKTLVEAGSELKLRGETQATYSRDIQNLTIAENNHDVAFLTDASTIINCLMKILTWK